MKRILLAHIVPFDKVGQYHVAQASHNFCYNLINSECFDKVYSIIPPNIFGKKSTFICDKYQLVYSILRRWKLTAKMATLLEQFYLFVRLKEPSNVWLYNMSPNNVFFVWLCTHFKKYINIYTIVLDFTPGLKVNDVMLKYINSSDGLIKLSNSNLFEVSNSICLPGIVPNGQPKKSVKLPIERTFLLSGVLYEHISLLSVVLEAFSKLPECKLIITGFGANEDLINKYTGLYSNIEYYGKVEYEKFISLLSSVPFVLSTRDENSPENSCNFPSKILEAILYNRIIVSTIEYPQIKDLNYFIIRQELEGMVADIKHIISMEEDELITYCNQGEKARNLFSPDVWKECMSKIETRYDTTNKNF